MKTIAAILLLIVGATMVSFWGTIIGAVSVTLLFGRR